MTSPVTTPAKGVQYFQHFPKNFLRPYGEGSAAPDDNTIFKRIAAFNCEWLVRPNVALSELASTVRLNMDVLQRHHRIVNVQELGNIETTIHDAIELLSKFDSKEKTADPNKKDLKKVVKFLAAEDQETEQFFQDCVKAGNAMFSMGIQYVVARALLTNPQHYAGMSRHNDSLDSHFKKDASVKEMMAYLEKTCLVQEKPTSSKRSLLEELEDLASDEEEAHEPVPKKKKMHKKSSKNVF